MATNPIKLAKAVKLSEAQLKNTIAGGGSISSGGDTYSADENTMYLTPDTSVSYEAQTLTSSQQAQARTNMGAEATQTVETYTVSSWTALASSEPYTYSATVSATYTIGNDTVIELINDQAVLFATYGFAVGSVSGQSMTIYSIGEPSSSVSLKIGYRG